MGEQTIQAHQQQAFGGSVPPNVDASAKTEQWNGTIGQK